VFFFQQCDNAGSAGQKKTVEVLLVWNLLLAGPSCAAARLAFLDAMRIEAVDIAVAEQRMQRLLGQHRVIDL
jgi:hypothetical protein